MDDKVKITKDTKDSNLKINYILEKQEEGLTRKEIRENMGYRKTGSLTEFMTRNGYKLVNDKFVENTEVELGGKEVAHYESIEKSIKIAEDKSHHVALHDKNLQDKLFNMLDKYDTFMEVMSLYEQDGWQRGGNETIVEVITGLQITYEEIETIKTSIRIEKNVWENFKQLGEENYKHISNTKLISQAVHEFIDKYKK